MLIAYLSLIGGVDDLFSLLFAGPFPANFHDKKRKAHRLTVPLYPSRLLTPFLFRRFFYVGGNANILLLPGGGSCGWSCSKATKKRGPDSAFLPLANRGDDSIYKSLWGFVQKGRRERVRLGLVCLGVYGRKCVIVLIGGGFGRKG